MSGAKRCIATIDPLQRVPRDPGHQPKYHNGPGQSRAFDFSVVVFFEGVTFHRLALARHQGENTADAPSTEYRQHPAPPRVSNEPGSAERPDKMI